MDQGHNHSMVVKNLPLPLVVEFSAGDGQMGLWLMTPKDIDLQPS